MRNKLLVLLIMSAALAYSAWANADEPEPCAHAAELSEQVEQTLQIVDELIELARPVCAERALARECALQRVEIRARIAEAKQLEALRKSAAAKCKAGTSTRKASAG